MTWRAGGDGHPVSFPKLWPGHPSNAGEQRFGFEACGATQPLIPERFCRKPKGHRGPHAFA
jgi:hypothetical protein